jgi:hypothetical protein
MSTPHLYQSRALKMYESQGSKGTRYYVRVAPWGPIAYPDDVDVPRKTYKTFRVGDPVCFGLHPGFFRAPCYASMPCPVPQNPAIQACESIANGAIPLGSQVLGNCNVGDDGPLLHIWPLFVILENRQVRIGIRKHLLADKTHRLPGFCADRVPHHEIRNVGLHIVAQRVLQNDRKVDRVLC